MRAKICPCCGEKCLGSRPRCRVCNTELQESADERSAAQRPRARALVAHRAVPPPASPRDPKARFPADATSRISARYVDGFLELMFFWLPVLLVRHFGCQEYRAGQSPPVSAPVILLFLALACYGLWRTLFQDSAAEGQSAGKSLYGLYVIDHPTGRPCSRRQSAIRAAARCLLAPFDLLLVLLGSSTLTDSLSGTRVIRRSPATAESGAEHGLLRVGLLLLPLAFVVSWVFLRGLEGF